MSDLDSMLEAFGVRRDGLKLFVGSLMLEPKFDDNDNLTIIATRSAEDRETICEACATGKACHSEPCPGVVEVPCACTNGLHL